MERDFSVEQLNKIGGPGGYREALVIRTPREIKYVLHEMFLVQERREDLTRRAKETGTLNDLVIAYFNPWRFAERHQKREYKDKGELLRGLNDWNLLREDLVETDETCGYPVSHEQFYGRITRESQRLGMRSKYPESL